MSHHCHAIGCRTSVPPKMFMCLKHWRMVPLQDQRLVWRLYKPRQEINKNPSMEYLRETNRIAIELAEREGMTDHSDYRIAVARRGNGLDQTDTLFSSRTEKRQ